MKYFIRSLIFHIVIFLFIAFYNHISLNNKRVVSSVSIISYSELNKQQAEIKQQIKKKKEEPIKKQAKAEEKTKKVEPEKKEEKAPPKEKKSKQSPANKKVTQQKKSESKQPKEIKPQSTPVIQNKNTPKETASVEVSGNLPANAAIATNNMPTKAITSKEDNEEISGNFDFDAMASSAKTSKKTEQSPKTNEFNEFLDGYLEESSENTNSSQVGANTKGSLTASEYDTLVKQIKSCWFYNSSAEASSNIVNIQLKLTMNKDATVKKIDVIGNYKDDTRKLLLRQAIDALKNPNCVPLKLPLNKYNIWKEITINFSS